MNKVVARFNDGTVLKGSTIDFAPDADTFHMVDSAMTYEPQTTTVFTRELKALFFVKDFAGDPGRVDSRTFERTPGATECEVGVFFKDGEIMVGTAPRYQMTGGRGFFFTPSDAASNNERAYVYKAAVRDLQVFC